MTPGDGSAAVPSEPRRWTLSGEDYGVPFGCVVTRGPGLLASEEVTVEEVGPVSEAQETVHLRLEEAARELVALFGGDEGRWKLDGRKVTDAASLPLLSITDWLNHLEAIRSGVPGAVESALKTRAVLSAAREVKSDGD